MSEINRSDIITDDALQAPIVLAKNLEAPIKALKDLLAVGKQTSAAIAGSDSFVKLKDETVKLNQEQKELIKIQNQIATVVAKNNEEYIKYEKQLQASKQALKEKSAIGEKDALAITKQNASINELTAALNKNRAAYAQLRSESERGSKEGKNLLTVIQQQDKDLKDLMATTGKHNLQVGNYEGAMKSLKSELKAAKDEMAGIASTLGTDSKEFVAAAEKAGKLKDEITDLNDSTKAVSGSPIENFGGTLSTVAGKLKGLDFKGASDAAKQFAQVSKTITLKEATSGLKDMGSTLTSVGRTLLTNPLFLLAAVIIGISVAVYALRDKLIPLKKAFEFLGDGVEYVVQKLKDFSDWLGLSTFAADDKAEKVIAAANREIDAIKKRYDREISIAEASGKEVKELEIKKWNEVIHQAAMGMQQLYEQRQRNGGKLTEEQQKQWDEYVEIVADANTEIQIIESKSYVERQKARKAAAEKAQKDAKESAEKAKKEEDRIRKEKEDNEKKDREDIIKKATEQSDKYYQQAKKALDDRIALVRQEVIDGKKLKSDGDKEILDLQKQFADDLIKAQIKGLSELLKVEQLTADERKAIEEKLNQLKIDLQKTYYDNVAQGQEITIEMHKATLQEWLMTTQGFVNSVNSLLQASSANRMAQIDAEQHAFEKSLNKQLKLAGDNETAKQILQDKADKKKEELDKKRIKEQRRAAVFEKELAAVNAVINVAVAATNEGSKGDPYTAFARIAAIVAALTPFAIAITKKDIPAYEFGVDDHPGGLAVVGDGGRHELVRLPSGKTFVTPDVPTLVNLPAHTKVEPRIPESIAMAGMEVATDQPRQIIVKVDNKELLSAVKSLKQPQLDYKRIGSDLYKVHKYSDGSVKYVRTKNMN
jgi:hypothetical protein